MKQFLKIWQINQNSSFPYDIVLQFFSLLGGSVEDKVLKSALFKNPDRSVCTFGESSGGI